ncbi:MAG: hypothetical protein ACI4F7_10345 [Acutalibacteraceae bacterium]
MKAMRKLIPALAMLLVSAVVLSSASFAWFTMSRQVTAQGMNVTVTAPNNLMIKEKVKNDDTYAEINSQEAQNIVLVPASTTNGKNFYQIDEGSAVNPSTGALYGNGETGHDQTKLVAGNVASDGTEGAYYDFKYTIKSDGGQTVNVVVSKVTATLKNDPAGELSVKPVRIAVMKSDESGIHLFNPNAGVHHTTGKAVKELDLNGYPTIDTVTYTTPATSNTDSNFIVTLTDSAPTADIIIRVWYEGEDTDCIVSKGAKANFDIEVVLADVASLS